MHGCIFLTLYYQYSNQLTFIKCKTYDDYLFYPRDACIYQMNVVIS